MESNKKDRREGVGYNRLRSGFFLVGCSHSSQLVYSYDRGWNRSDRCTIALRTKWDAYDECMRAVASAMGTVCRGILEDDRQTDRLEWSNAAFPN